MKRRFVNVSVLLLGIGLVGSCKTIGPGDTADLGKILGKGVQCFLAPSGYYKPGTVFRIDKQGVTYIANKTLADVIPVDSKPAAVGSFSGKQTLSVSVLASLLDLEEQGQNLASVNASVGRTRTLEAKLENVTLQLTDDTQIDQVVDWFGVYNRKRKDSDYYVVREAYLADSMGLKLTKELKADLGGEAKIKQAVKLNPKLNYDPSATYDLTAPFGAKLYVCMKPEKLKLQSVGIAGSQYQTERVNTRLPIKQDGGVEN